MSRNAQVRACLRRTETKTGGDFAQRPLCRPAKQRLQPRKLPKNVTLQQIKETRRVCTTAGLRGGKPLLLAGFMQPLEAAHWY
ncbi:MAG: hypothetical protein KGJ44_12155 [Betaproteobacteria bacterium]|nr:hypothetical protein [Betaproteobacteria bacterium]